MAQSRKYLLILLAVVCTAHIVHSAPVRNRRVELLVQPEDIPESNSLPPKQNNEGEEGVFFEGDIRLKPGEDPYNILHSYRHRVGRREVILTDEAGSGDHPVSDLEFTSLRTWPSHRIPFDYKPSLSPMFRTTFKEAMDAWETVTCLQFAAKTAEDTDYIYFTDEDGCSSYVGRKGGKQEVSINKRCDKTGHAMHEIGHALGFWHEHSRPDRGDYINILWENVRENKQMNFGRISDEEFAAIPDVGYDLESIMHYGPYAFSISKREGLRTIDVIVDVPSCALDVGQRNQLSYKDKLRINELYQCTDKITELAEQRPNCPPTPSPTPTPTPSPSPPPTTPKTPGKPIIKSGSIIRVEYEEGDRAEGEDLAAMSCQIGTTGCYKESCNTGGFLATGCSIMTQFEINLTESRRNRNVKSGDTVVLKSIHRPTRWVDCTMGPCTITEGTNNEADFNSSYVSSRHIFKIYAINRSDGKTIRSSDKVVFTNPVNQTEHLNCLGKKCVLLEEGDCPGSGITNPEQSEQCATQKFVVEKL